MKSIWLPYDKTLDHYSRKEVSNLIRNFLYIISGVAVVLSTVNFILGYTDIALTTLTVPFFFCISMYFLNRGHINVTMIIITSIMIIATSMICFIGVGIHEVGIIIFPVIVFFSSLVMNFRGVVVTASLVVFCLLLIVLEEQVDFFQRENYVSNWMNLLVALSVLSIHSIMTFKFSRITRDNLKKVKEELTNQDQYKKEIADNLIEKTELLRLVHHRVKNNLLLINSLIELEAYEKPDIKLEFKEITDSIHTIARAHDPLYHTDDYKQVATKPYVEKLLSTLVQSNPLKNLSTNIADSLIFHEKAILLGIILQRILVSLKEFSSLELSVILEQKENLIDLVISSENERKLEMVNDSLIFLLSKQMAATLIKTHQKIELKFEIEKERSV